MRNTKVTKWKENKTIHCAQVSSDRTVRNKSTARFQKFYIHYKTILSDPTGRLLIFTVYTLYTVHAGEIYSNKLYILIIPRLNEIQSRMLYVQYVRGSLWHCTVHTVLYSTVHCTVHTVYCTVYCTIWNNKGRITTFFAIIWLWCIPREGLKVHKIENFFGSEFEFYTISLLVMLKY